jgi:hypothetical protein
VKGPWREKTSVIYVESRKAPVSAHSTQPDQVDMQANLIPSPHGGEELPFLSGNRFFLLAVPASSGTREVRDAGKRPHLTIRPGTGMSLGVMIIAIFLNPCGFPCYL